MTKTLPLVAKTKKASDKCLPTDFYLSYFLSLIAG
jgi:hypothetical protein